MTILVENIDDIRIITLNRPEKLNAITLEMATELNSTLQEASADSTVKCVILTGKGRSFSSGGDVNEMAEHSPKAGELFYKLTDQIHSSFTAILRMKKPVINALNGIIAGGALGIALGGDYRIAAKSTRMLSAHFKRGFVPAGGATYLLPRLIGLGRTQALFFGGKTLDSAEMLEWGLVHEIVEDEYLKEKSLEWAKKLSKGPISAIAETKQLLIDSDTLSLEEELQIERDRNRKSGNSGDAVEGIQAFIDKREPEFE